jgi:ankyrin repeat protein
MRITGVSTQYPLHAAARTGNYRKILDIMDKCEPTELEFMLSQKDGYGDTPLHSCFPKKGEEQQLEPARAKKCATALISRGADVNAVDNDNTTPLHACAIRWDMQPIIILLLNAGADPKILSCDDETAQDFAMENNHDQTAKLLQDPRQRFNTPFI